MSGMHSFQRSLLVVMVVAGLLVSTRRALAFTASNSGRVALFQRRVTFHPQQLRQQRQWHPPSGWQTCPGFRFRSSSFSTLAATTTTSIISTKTKTKTASTTAVTTKKKSTKSVTKETTTSATSLNRSRPFRLVIVESPAKCKTISKILNDFAQQEQLPFDFVVTACMGHLRNLSKRRVFGELNDQPIKSPVVGVNVYDHYTPDYEVLPEKQQVLHDLQQLAEQAEAIVLATDDDREGEAIAWHLCQLLADSVTTTSTSTTKKKQKPTEAKKKLLQRVTFTEITPQAIQNAFSAVTTSSSKEEDDQHSFDNLSSVLNMNLVEAQETRRILDRLAGFTMSPLLWKKIAPGLSAGRVQSVGLALVVQRERQRLAHRSTEYATLHGTFESTYSSNSKNQLEATLIKVNGQTVARKSGDFESTTGIVLPNRIHLTPNSVQDLVATLGHPVDSQATTTTTWRVLSVTSSPRTMSPPVPFKTSTLQQEAYGKLGLPVAVTMRLAQNLYEDGKISYMRTDSIHLSTEADAVVEKTIQSQYHKFAVGQAPSAAATTKSSKKKKQDNNKFAQEAHEAIRPSIQPDGSFLTPDEVDSSMSSSAADLYRLIYQRTIASRMTPQRLNQTSIVIEGRTKAVNGEDGDDSMVVVEFRWSGSVVIDPGFTIVYDVKSDDDEKSTVSASAVPALSEGQILRCHELAPEDHVTQPPPRYTEASLVKELEALGVGRPSTYASIVQILRDRAYVGSLQSSSSSSSFKGNQIRAPKAGSIMARRAAGGDDSLSFANNRRGALVPSLTAFVVCSLLERYCPSYVDPSFTANMEERLDWIATGQNDEDRVKYLDEFYAGDQGLAAQVQRIDENVDAADARRARLPSLFSGDEADNDEDEVGLFIGPWGPYVQKVGASSDDGGTTSKPPSAPLPASMAADLSAITLPALKTLLSTRSSGGIVLGQHPDDGRNIRLKVGRFGSYLQWGEDGEDSTTTHSLPKNIGNVRNLDPGTDELDEYQDGDDATENTSLGGGVFRITFEEAVGYTSLPRTVGMMNDLPITTSLGPRGPYLKYNNTYVSLSPADGDVLTVDAETAQRLVMEGASGTKSKKTNQNVVSDLGEIDGGSVRVMNGRFGMYINWKKINAKLPPEYVDNPSGLSMDEAWELIQKKSSTSTPKKESATKKKSAVLKSAAPKRSKSAYLYFCQEKRHEIAKTFKSLGEVSKELGRLWKEISAEERKVYDELAVAGKADPSTQA